MKMCCTGERCASLSRVKEMRVRNYWSSYSLRRPSLLSICTGDCALHLSGVQTRHLSAKLAVFTLK